MDFYDSVVDWLLPHLKGRPVSLVRASTGIIDELSFERHLGDQDAGHHFIDAAGKRLRAVATSRRDP